MKYILILLMGIIMFSCCSEEVVEETTIKVTTNYEFDVAGYIRKSLNSGGWTDNIHKEKTFFNFNKVRSNMSAIFYLSNYGEEYHETTIKLNDKAITLTSEENTVISKIFLDYIKKKRKEADDEIRKQIRDESINGITETVDVEEEW